MAGNLPQRLTLPQTQQQWAAILNPAINSPILQGQLLEGIPLLVGLNQINHGLQRNWIGWIVVDNNNGALQLQVDPNNNQTPILTIPMTSSAVATISLWVF